MATMESTSEVLNKLCSLHIKEIISIIANTSNHNSKRVICLFDIPMAQKCFKGTPYELPNDADMSALIAVVPVKDYSELIDLMGQDRKRFVDPLKVMSSNDYPVIAVTERGAGLFTYPIDIAKDIFKREFHHFIGKEFN